MAKRDEPTDPTMERESREKAGQLVLLPPVEREEKRAPDTHPCEACGTVIHMRDSYGDNLDAWLCADCFRARVRELRFRVGPNLEDEAKLDALPVSLVDGMTPSEKAEIAAIRAKALSHEFHALSLGEVRDRLVAEHVVAPGTTSEDVMCLIHGRSK